MAENMNFLFSRASWAGMESQIMESLGTSAA